MLEHSLGGLTDSYRKITTIGLGDVIYDLGKCFDDTQLH